MRSVFFFVWTTELHASVAHWSLSQWSFWKAARYPDVKNHFIKFESHKSFGCNTDSLKKKWKQSASFLAQKRDSPKTSFLTLRKYLYQNYVSVKKFAKLPFRFTPLSRIHLVVALSNQDAKGSTCHWRFVATHAPAGCQKTSEQPFKNPLTFFLSKSWSF